MANTVTMNVRISEQLKKKLQRLAKKQLGGNLSQLVTLICQDFIDNGRQVTIGKQKEIK